MRMDWIPSSTIFVEVNPCGCFRQTPFPVICVICGLKLGIQVKLPHARILQLLNSVFRLLTS